MSTELTFDDVMRVLEARRVVKRLAGKTYNSARLKKKLEEAYHVAFLSLGAQAYASEAVCLAILGWPC